MRLFTLASLVVASAVVGLVTLAPAVVAAAPAAPAKRVAKRAGTSAHAESARVLPAPLPKPEVLPPLPPVARDVTSITSITSMTTVTSASIGDGTAESLPALPAAEPSVAAVTTSATSPTRDVVEPPPRTAAGHAVNPSGFVVSLGSGALVPASTFITGLRPLGPGVAFELRLGYYATPHFGILTGVRGSYGHTIGGCSGCDGGYSTQVPLVIQLAATDRACGFYTEVGVGLGTTYAGNAGSGQTYAFSSPIEGKLAFGYRIAGAHGAAMATTADFNVGVDVGAIDTAEVKTKSGSVLTDKSDQPTHAVVAMSLRLHFSP